MKRKLSTEILIILTASIVFGLTVNFISPNGISLIRDDSERFAIDTTSKTNSPSSERKYTKEGFVKPQNVKFDFAKKLYDDGALFIDGRDPHEFQQGHIQNAINIPYKEFVNKSRDEKLEIMRTFDKEKTIVSYCGGSECEISIDNAYEFAKIGYNEVKIYLGGHKEWTQLGYPSSN